jgi:hypothetical protein
MSYKQEKQRGYKHKPQGNIGMKKQHCATKQVKSNVPITH